MKRSIGTIQETRQNEAKVKERFPKARELGRGQREGNIFPLKSGKYKRNLAPRAQKEENIGRNSRLEGVPR